MMRRNVRMIEAPRLRAPFSYWPEEWPEICPRLGTAVSAWGDVMVSCGMIEELLRRTNSDRIGVIYYGKYKEIAEWLSRQPWCTEVVFRRQASLQELVDIASCTDSYAEKINIRPMLGDVSEDDVFPTHIRTQHNRFPHVYPYTQSTLSAEAWDWAADFMSKLPPDTYFFHPWSFQSVRLTHHWQGWQKLAEHMLKTTPHTYLLTGVGYNGADFGEHPRLINTVGKVNTMEQVLALAALARGVITTCNSPSLWSSARQLKCFCLSNDAILDERNVFYRFINLQPNVTWHWKFQPYEEIEQSFDRWVQ
jgi:hypothetical protein